MTLEEKVIDYQKKIRWEKDSYKRRELLTKLQSLKSTMAALADQDQQSNERRY